MISTAIRGLGILAGVVAILLGMFFVVSAGVGFIDAVEARATRPSFDRALMICGGLFVIGAAAMYMGFRILRRHAVAEGDVSPSTPPQLRTHALRSLIAGVAGIAGGLLLEGGLRWFLLICGVVSIFTAFLMFRVSRRRGF